MDGSDNALAWWDTLPSLATRHPQAWCRYASWTQGDVLRLTVIAPAGVAAPGTPPRPGWRRLADPYRCGRWTWGIEVRT